MVWRTMPGHGSTGWSARPSPDCAAGWTRWKVSGASSCRRSRPTPSVVAVGGERDGCRADSGRPGHGDGAGEGAAGPRVPGLYRGDRRLVAHRTEVPGQRTEARAAQSRAEGGRAALRDGAERSGGAGHRDWPGDCLGASGAAGPRVAGDELRAVGEDGGRGALRAEPKRDPGHVDPPRLGGDPARAPGPARPGGGGLPPDDGTVVGGSVDVVARVRGGKRIAPEARLVVRP